MPCSSRGFGQYAANQKHGVRWDRMTKADAPLLIYCQGSHGIVDTVSNNEEPDMEALARAGFIVAMGDLTQTQTQGTFGNDAAQAGIGQLRTFMQGSGAPIKAASGKMYMVGGSGGGANAINYARNNPGNVFSMVFFAPLLDLQDLYENRLPASGVTQAEVNAAYGGDVTAFYDTHSPIEADKTPLINIPIKIYYATDDPFIPVASVTTFRDQIEAVGGICELQSLGAVGHTDVGVIYEDEDIANDVTDFLLAHS